MIKYATRHDCASVTKITNECFKNSITKLKKMIRKLKKVIEKTKNIINENI